MTKIIETIISKSLPRVLDIFLKTLLFVTITLLVMKLLVPDDAKIISKALGALIPQHTSHFFNKQNSTAVIRFYGIFYPLLSAFTVLDVYIFVIGSNIKRIWDIATALSYTSIFIILMLDLKINDLVINNVKFLVLPFIILCLYFYEYFMAFHVQRLKDKITTKRY